MAVRVERAGYRRWSFAERSIRRSIRGVPMTAMDLDDSRAGGNAEPQRHTRWQTGTDLGRRARADLGRPDFLLYASG
jgi:hypothetical protein